MRMNIFIFISVKHVVVVWIGVCECSNIVSIYRLFSMSKHPKVTWHKLASSFKHLSLPTAVPSCVLYITMKDRFLNPMEPCVTFAHNLRLSPSSIVTLVGVQPTTTAGLKHNKVYQSSFHSMRFFWGSHCLKLQNCWYCWLLILLYCTKDAQLELPVSASFSVFVKVY